MFFSCLSTALAEAVIASTSQSIFDGGKAHLRARLLLDPGPDEPPPLLVGSGSRADAVGTVVRMFYFVCTRGVS